MIYLQLFFSFLQVGLFSIGGGYAAIPLIQSQAVDKYGWLSLSEFTNLVTVAEMTPGPIGVNAATFTGIQIAGVGGAVVDARVHFPLFVDCFRVGTFVCQVQKKHGVSSRAANLTPRRGCFDFGGGIEYSVVGRIRRGRHIFAIRQLHRYFAVCRRVFRLAQMQMEPDFGDVPVRGFEPWHLYDSRDFVKLFAFDACKTNIIYCCYPYYI